MSADHPSGKGITELTQRLREILSIEDWQARMYHRDEAFYLFLEAMECLAKSIDTWIRTKVLLNQRVPMLFSEIESVRNEIELAALDHILDQLQEEPRKKICLMPDEEIFHFVIRVADKANLPRDVRNEHRKSEGDLTRTLRRQDDPKSRPELVTAVEPAEENEGLPEYLWGVQPFLLDAVEELRVYDRFCRLDSASKLLILLDRLTTDTIAAFDLAATRCGIDAGYIRPYRDRLNAWMDSDPNHRRIPRSEMAAIMDISQPTLRTRIENAYCRLGLHPAESSAAMDHS